MANAPARSVAYVCPICSTAVPSIDESTSVQASAAHRYRPFCSARCQRIDMGNWLGERYTIPASEQPTDGDGTAKCPDGEDDSGA